MAITTNTHSLPLGAITLHRVGAAAADIAGRFTAWRDARRTAQVLNGLSARQLEDIGLDRGQIETLIQHGRI